MDEEDRLEVKQSGKESAGKGLFVREAVGKGETLCVVFGTWVVSGIHPKREDRYRFRLNFPGQERHAARRFLLYEVFQCQAMMINDFKGDYNCEFILEEAPNNPNDFTFFVQATRPISQVCLSYTSNYYVPLIITVLFLC